MMSKYNNKNSSQEAVIQYLYNNNDFDEIPPIIGVLLADLYGNAIMTYEFDEKSEFGPIQSYLSERKGKKTMSEIDFVSMYFSSFKAFASDNNIKNLKYLEILGSNLKIQISFLDERFMIILFLNSNTVFSLKLHKYIMEHFNHLIIEQGYNLKEFNNQDAREIIGELKRNGSIWLKKVNKRYLKEFKEGYLKKTEYVSTFINKIGPIIHQELKEYLGTIPDEILCDISREIKNKIHNEAFELASELFKK